MSEQTPDAHGSEPNDVQPATPVHRTHLLHYIPHIVAVIVGLVAFTEFLEHHEEGFADFLEYLLNELDQYTPSSLRDNFSLSLHRCNGFFVSCFFKAVIFSITSGGILGGVILSGTFVFYLAVVRTLRPNDNPLVAILAFPFGFPPYATVLKWALFYAVYVLGSFVVLLTAFLCYIAAFFLGFKVLLAPLLEMYHAGESGQKLFKLFKMFSGKVPPRS